MIHTISNKVPARLIVALLVFGMVFSGFLAIPVATAADTQIVSVSTGSGTPDQSVQLGITMNDGVGISGIQFTVNYDSSQLSVSDADNDFDGLADSIIAASGLNLGSPPTVGLFNGYINFQMNRAGGVAIPEAAAGQTVNLAGINFTVKTGAINGTYPITVTNLQAFDYNGNPVVLGTSVAGSITVTGGAAAPSSAKAITAFSFANPAATGVIDEANKTVAVTVPFGTDVTNLTPTIAVSDLATVAPTSGTAQNFTAPVTYTVTAEDGTTQNYVVTVTVAPASSEKAITAFSFTNPQANGVINETNKTIAVNVPFGTDVTSLTPTITVSGFATVSPNSGVAQDFTSPVTYTVTAQDGTNQPYVVTVTPALNSAKAITGFSFANPAATGVINENAKTIAVEVPFGTDVTALVPTITVSPDATVSPTSGTAQNFSSPATYTVTAQDSTSVQYTVTVTVAAASANAALSNLTVNGTPVTGFNASTLTYNAGLPFGAAIPTVAGVAADANATVNVTQATNLSGTEAERTATVVVTAQDGTTSQTYRVIFEVAKQFTVTATKQTVGNRQHVTVNVNNAGGATTATIIVALYDTTTVNVSEMKALIFDTASIAGGANNGILTGGFVVPTNYTIKAFVWDNFTNQTALSNVVTP